LFKAADCDTDHYLVVVKVKGRGVVSDRRFAGLKDLDVEVDINSVRETIRENIKMSAKENQGY
jgi:hypothetical protein